MRMKEKTEKQTGRFLIAFIILLPVFSLAQQARYISGKVTDSANGQPVARCSVYFSNTSKGDITSASGEFILKNLPAGKYELVVSAIGYETQVTEVSSNDYPHQLNIKLHLHSTELSEIVIEPSLANGWQKWGQTFLENFIGTTQNANHCYLKNQEVLKFWFSEKNNRLTVRAEEPLVIENKALGYIIKFKLEEFSLDFNSQILVYNGYPLFQEIESSTKESKWKQNRKDAYYGSLLEFMRCVYKDTWLQSGYHIVAYVKRPNAEKLRIQKITEAALQAQNNGKENTVKPFNSAKDSTVYYRRILKQPDSLSEYVSLPDLDSLLITNNDGSKSLFFKNKLKIIYQRYPPSVGVNSEIYLSTPEAIRIQENGSYFSTKELVTFMHWAEYEKISNLLPFDYEP
jgi:hypothetical protein